MYWVNYLIKCIIRRLTYLFLNKKTIFFIIIVFLIILIFLNPLQSKAYTGDDTYTDKNATITLSYDTVINDLINRLSNTNSNTSSLLKKLKNASNSYYVYYGNDDGSSVLNVNNYWDTNKLNIAVFPKTNLQLSVSPVYETYLGIDVSCYGVKNITVYTFHGNSLDDITIKPDTVYMPGVLINYYSSDLVSFLNDSSKEQTNDVINAIDKQTQATENLTNTITSEDTQQSSDDLNNSFTDVTNSVEDRAEFVNIFDFFKNINNTFKSAFEGFSNKQPIIITLGIPYTDKQITLSSDIVYNAIHGTLFYTLLQVIYTTTIGFYLINSFFNIIAWLQSGEFLNGHFISHRNLILYILDK